MIQCDMIIWCGDKNTEGSEVLMTAHDASY